SNGTSNPVYRVDTLGSRNGAFSITSMTTVPSSTGVDLRINIRRTNQQTAGTREVTRTIPLKVIVNGGAIESCYSDADSVIDSAVQAACKGNSARWDEARRECVHDLVVLTCPPGRVLSKVESDTSTQEIVSQCVPLFPAEAACPTGQFINSIASDGTAVCSPIKSPNSAVACAEGQYLKTIENGNVECINFPSCGRQEILCSYGSGNFKCLSFAHCNTANQYAEGLSSTG